METLTGTPSLSRVMLNLGSFCVWTLSLGLVLGFDQDSNLNCTRSHISNDLSSDLSSVTCQLETLNSEFDRTNLSGIPGEGVVSLNLECSHVLLYQSSLIPKSLAHFPGLTSLQVDHCKLAHLATGSFAGLPLLRNLSVRTKNTAWPALSLNVGPGILDSLKQVERVDLSENNIWALPPDLFCAPGSLRYLNLSLNRLQDTAHLGLGSKEPCRLGLQVLDLSRNRLLLLPSKGLMQLGDLKELYLQNNHISSVGQGALNGLKGLKIFFLADNRLSTLPPDLFRDTPDLTEIHLENNTLGTLAPSTFSSLRQLLVLDLSQNHIASDWMSGDPLAGLVRLVLLKLAHNWITELTPQTFNDLYSLQILNLAANRIEVIAPSTFSAMTNLHTLILSYNRLRSIDASALNGLFVLSLLSLDNNNVSLINPAAFHNCSSLKDINLNSNNLSSIPAALQNLRFLRTVDLGENGIEDLGTIEPKLVGLPNLYGLRLTGNRIVNVSKEALKELPALKVLNLARNRIQRVEARAFESNANLQAVRLDANYLTQMDNLFSPAPSLIWLNMSDNRLSSFDYTSIPAQLQWLDMHKNGIPSLENAQGRTDLRLQTLDASFNRIERLGSGNVPESIEMLFLNDNLLSHIEPHTFLDKLNLSRVDLFGNQLESLDQSALRLTPFPIHRPLPEFYMGGNPILCDCNMEWLQRINRLDHLRQHPKIMDLQSLYCKLVYHRSEEYIPLMDADPAQFLCPYSQHCFHLCHCCDFGACDCQMTCPSNCTCYHDDAWSANIADCASRGHSIVPPSIPMDSTQVYLDGNQFTQLPSHVFIARKNLQVLYLNNSGISLIANNSFSGLKRLAVLHLENNLLSQLEGHEFEPLHNLRELYLQSNHLVFVSNSTFLTLRELEVLKLDGNKLSQFTMWTLSLNPYLVQIGLNSNPWSCDCDFVGQAAPWIQANQAKILHPSGLTCRIHGKSMVLMQFSENVTNCSDLRALSGAGAESEPIPNLTYLLFCGGIVATALVFVMILLAICRKRVWATSKVRLEDQDTLYDAYVVYSVKDEAWVKQVLVSELTQNDVPWRLLLHYKEFGGSSYMTGERIVEAVEISKRTILVLSKNFLQSEWTRFELKSGLHAALRGSKNRLVALTLGDVGRRDLDPNLRVTLRQATVISTGDKMFWTKLKSALPRPTPSYSPQRRLDRTTAASTLSRQKGTSPFYIPPYPAPRDPPPPAPLPWSPHSVPPDLYYTQSSLPIHTHYDYGDS